MSKLPSNNYVDGERLCALAADAASSGEFSDELVALFYSLARQRCWKFNPRSEQSRLGGLVEEDMLQEAVMLCVQKTPKFDETKLKQKHYAFYFFKQIVDQCFIRLYEHANRQKRKPEKGTYNLDRHLRMLDIDWLIEDNSDIEDNLRQTDGAPKMSLLNKEMANAIGCKPTEDLADLIIDMRQQKDNGVTYSALAEEYGMDIELVEHLILRGAS